MKERLDKGDIVQVTKGATIWFVEEVGGENLGATMVQGRCVKPRPSNIHPFGSTATLGRPMLSSTTIIGQAVDFDHACAIVALLG